MNAYKNPLFESDEAVHRTKAGGITPSPKTLGSLDLNE
jgi:hypothetical protein